MNGLFSRLLHSETRARPAQADGADPRTCRVCGDRFAAWAGAPMTDGLCPLTGEGEPCGAARAREATRSQTNRAMGARASQKEQTMIYGNAQQGASIGVDFQQGAGMASMASMAGNQIAAVKPEGMLNAVVGRLVSISDGLNSLEGRMQTLCDRLHGQRGVDEGAADAPAAAGVVGQIANRLNGAEAQVARLHRLMDELALLA